MNELRWKKHFLNNFFTRFPAGHSRFMHERIKGRYSQEELEKDPELHQSIEINTQIYRDVDEIIDRLKLDKAQLEAWVTDPGGLSDRTPAEFVDVLLKVYIELRKLGYKHDDLQR